MDKIDKNKIQKVSDFDFSQDRHHIALVDKPANGTDPLIIKSLDGDKEVLAKIDIKKAENKEPEDQLVTIQKGEFFEGDDVNISGVRVNLALEDMLWLTSYMSRDEAKLVSNSIVKSADDDTVEALEEALEGALSILDGSNGSASGATAAGGPAPIIVKSEESMKDDKQKNKPEAFSKEDLEKAVADALADQREELEKSESTDQNELVADLVKQVAGFKEREDIRKAAEFTKEAVGYEALGVEAKDLAPVLMKMADSDKESYGVISKALTSAVEVLDNADLLKEKGEDGRSDAGADTTDKLLQEAEELMKSEGISKSEAIQRLTADLIVSLDSK